MYRLFSLRGLLRGGLLGLVLAVLLPGGYLAGLQVSGNFHTVIPGELYRSGQPDAEAIERAAALGIRTIINLRGEKPEKAWYQAEAEAAERSGITLVNFRMSARHPLSTGDAAQLLALMESAEKPLLIHCRAGADRTGLASALYLSRAGETERAGAQLSPYYGHIPLSLVPESAMSESFETLRPLASYQGS